MKFGELFDAILEKSRELKLTDSQAMVWLTMVYIWRQNKYRHPLPITQDQIQLYVDASKRTIQRAIRILIEQKIITAEKCHRKPTCYKFAVIASLGRQTLHSLGDKPYTQDGSRVTNPPPSRVTNPRVTLSPPSIVNTSITNTNNGSCGNKGSITYQKPFSNQKPKKLSMWVLKNQKESREAELKELRCRGHEDAWGQHFRNKEDAKRAKELKVEIRELNRQMQNAN